MCISEIKVQEGILFFQKHLNHIIVTANTIVLINLIHRAGKKKIYVRFTTRCKFYLFLVFSEQTINSTCIIVLATFTVKPYFK